MNELRRDLIMAHLLREVPRDLVLVVEGPDKPGLTEAGVDNDRLGEEVRLVKDVVIVILAKAGVHHDHILEIVN